MATVYQKTADDKCLILEPREALLRETNIPDNWTDIRLAVAMSFTTASDDNAIPVSESTANINRLSHFFFGLKDGSQIAPGFAGSQFLGRGSNLEFPSGVDVVGDNTLVRSGYSIYPMYAYTGVAQSISAEGSSGGAFDAPTVSTGTTLYAKFRGVKFTRSGNVITSYISSDASAVTDVSVASLRMFLEGVSWSTPHMITDGWWGASAPVGLKHFYIRLPALNNRLRIHNYGYLVVS